MTVRADPVGAEGIERDQDNVWSFGAAYQGKQAKEQGHEPVQAELQIQVRNSGERRTT